MATRAQQSPFTPQQQLQLRELPIGQGNVFDLVRESCERYVQACPDVHVNEEAVAKVANEIDKDKVLNAPEMGVPLKFPTIRDEINFIALVDLLNFGSGYRLLLKDHCKRGAFETILYGCMGFYITQTINTDFMCKVTLTDVGQTFDIPLDVDVELQPAVYTTKPHKLKPLAEQIRSVLNETGIILRSLQCEDFAQFILGESPKGNTSEEKKEPMLAVTLVSRLVTSFPAFNDRYMHQDQTVFIFKKAQLLVADLYRKFQQKDSRFNFPDISQLTIFADNVIPAVLIQLGALKISDSLQTLITEHKDLSADPNGTALRAASIVACERILHHLRSTSKDASDSSQVLAMHLDYYLWNLGKEDAFRQLTRHAAKATIFY